MAVQGLVAIGAAVAPIIARVFGIGVESPLRNWTSEQIRNYLTFPWKPEYVAAELRSLFSYPIEVRRTWTVADIDQWRSATPSTPQTPQQPTYETPQVITPSYAVPATTGDTLISGLSATAQYAAGAFIQHLRSNGFQVVVTSGFRTWSEQARLWLDYIMGRSKYPVARPGSSDHEKGWALDLSIQYQGAQLTAEQLQSIDMPRSADYFWLTWGGSKDPVHFSLDTEGMARAYLAANRTPPADILGPVLTGTP